MTPAQATTLAHPCYLAGETLHPRFDPWLVGPISVKVSINAGYE